MIVIIDYGMGNLRNVQKVFIKLGYKDVIISDKIEDLKNAEAYVLSGVGSFHDAMKNIEDLELVSVIREEILENKKPILGICLGMQLFAQEGDEGGQTKGIGLLPMKVEKLKEDSGYKLPHIGWNDTIIKNNNSVLFEGIPDLSDFYYVHTYGILSLPEEMVLCTCKYSCEFVSAIEYKNIFATQFHPEKSQRLGMKVVKNFINYVEDNKNGN